MNLKKIVIEVARNGVIVDAQFEHIAIGSVHRGKTVITEWEDLINELVDLGLDKEMGGDPPNG